MNRVFFFSCLAGLGLGLEVHQSHSDLIKKSGDRIQVSCNHERTNYRVILWYQQSPGDTAMKLIGYLYFETSSIEEEYKKGFDIIGNLGGDTAKNASLIFKSLEQSHTAVYYCAASEPTANYEPAYFGRGTKLTVLEKDNPITPPTVKVFRPSDKECKDPISEKEKKKTIVCVASNFYPDHVSVSWEGNGKKIITKGVATDAVAKRDGKFYRISSRLTVPIGEWLKQVPYTCKVNFFNGTVISVHNDSTTSNTKDTDMTRENYLKITQNAKLSYGVLIVKSCVYAAFVCFLVWKLQEKRRKDAK